MSKVVIAESIFRKLTEQFEGDRRCRWRKQAEVQMGWLAQVACRLAQRWNGPGGKVYKLDISHEIYINPWSRVTMLKYDPLRDAQIMMTGYGTHLRWQVATDQVCWKDTQLICKLILIQVKEGDLIRTHTAIPLNPIRPAEGDSHPLGALPMGTTVCMVR